MWKIIGIDLWTTNSCFAFMEGGQAKVIQNSEGSRTTPSIVALNKEKNIIVWTPAKRQSITNPLNTIFSAKRFIGRKYDEVTWEIKNFPFEVVKGKDGSALIKFNDKEVRPEEISAHVLMKIKEDAEKFLWEKVTEAVITVPAYFNDSERQATINAWKIAGLEVKRIVNEPTAAALSYGLGKGKNEKVAVYDLGWGTFDISILELSEEWTFEVLSTNWDTHLGWDDFDHAIVEYVMSEFQKDRGIDLRKDVWALQRVRDEAEKAKKELSSTTEYEINLPYITVMDWVPETLVMTITRAKFEELVSDLVSRSIEPCKKVLQDAGLKASDLDEIILVWGSTRVPLVQKKVEEFFGKKPNSWVNPDEAVAMWAAVQAWILQWDVNDILLLDVTPLSLSIETMWGVATKMIPRNTTLPTSKSEVFSTAADNQPQVDIHILQGERDMAVDNKSLGKFVLDGIAPAPRWVPKIEVTFDIDANWVLHVTAKDQWTGKEQKITIQGSTWMSDEEVDNLVKEAEANREADKIKKELVEAKNMADSSCFQAEKLVEDNKEKVSEDSQKQVEEKVKEIRELLAKEDVTKEDLESKTKELNELMMKIGQEEIYKQDETSGSDSQDKWWDDVQDAEVDWDDNKDNSTRV